MIKIKTDPDGFIVALGSGLIDWDHTYNGQKNLSPKRGGDEKAWHWNDGSPEIRDTATAPGGESAWEQIRAHMKDKHGVDAAYDLGDDNPMLIEAIKNEKYQAVDARLKTLVTRGVIEQADADKIRSILKL